MVMKKEGVGHHIDHDSDANVLSAVCAEMSPVCRVFAVECCIQSLEVWLEA